MRYVDLNATIDGMAGVISPTEYLARLPVLADALPPGARAFATDPDHYDFSGKRCVKDLDLERVRNISADGSEIELGFRHNCWKHDEDLVIRYSGVSGCIIRSPGGSDPKNLRTVILDEILPHEHGCVHEIAFRPGTLTVVCRDLTAVWVETDCPDLPAPD